MGALDALRDMGLRVPEDVSLVGFDDIPAASEMQPPLTTVHQPLAEMGAQGARMLLSLVHGEPLSLQRVELHTQLIVRDSCRPINQQAVVEQSATSSDDLDAPADR
ncbi:MAG: hypothetical protein Kow0047_19740 [Anaerolineae bacterium]